MSGRHVIAIDVGGTTMKGALVDAAGGLACVERRPTNREEGGDVVVDRILAFARDLLDRAREQHGETDVRAVGLGVPGLVDEANGMAVSAVNLGWDRIPLARLVRDSTGLPAVLGHDVRLAGLAEGRLGAAAGSMDYLFIALGTGIGAAAVLRGQAYTGSHGVGGEFGHMVVDPEGPPCACGKRGCVEALSSAGAIERRYAALCPGARDVSARDVAALVNAGNLKATQVWDEAVAALGRAIANYAILLDPELVVIGGGLASAGATLFEPLGDTVAGAILFEPGPRIEPAGLGDDAGCIGAGLNAWITPGVQPEAPCN